MAENGEPREILINPSGKTKKVSPITHEGQAELDRQAVIMGKSFAEAMGTPEPEKELDSYRNAEEFGTPFSIKAGAEPRFMVIYQHDKEEWLRQRRIWEYRSIFVQARSQKQNAGSVDTAISPAPEERGLDPLGVEFKKERFEYLFKEMPGFLTASSIYTTILGAREFVGHSQEDRQRLFNQEKDRNFDFSIQNPGEEPVKLWSVKDKLLGVNPDYISGLDLPDKDKKELIEEWKQLRENCPESVYEASEPGFYAIRESIRFFLKTRATNLLVINDEDKEKVINPADDHGGVVEKRTEGETLLERMTTRAREAEQVAWNFIFSTGLLESMNVRENNQYLRTTKNKDGKLIKPRGPSNFMTLYLWMVLHPQQRFEDKVLNSGGGAKENWSSLGDWAINNIQKERWKNIKTGGLAIPKFIRPDLVLDALRGANKKVFFDKFVKKGPQILEAPENFTPENILKDVVETDAWENMGDSPFVSYRFDTLRWAGVIFSIFKKGIDAQGKVPLSDLAEAARNLKLTQTEKMNLLKMYNGINVNSVGIDPAEGPLAWHTYLSRLRRVQPDLFVSSE